MVIDNKCVPGWTLYGMALWFDLFSVSAYSPSSTCYEDTYNTLKYADRAKNIKSDLKSNVISVDFHVSKYAKIVEELKQQVRYNSYDIFFLVFLCI